MKKVYIPVLDMEMGNKAFSSRKSAMEVAEARLTEELKTRPYLEKYTKEELIDILEFELVEDKLNLPNLPSKL